MSEHVTLRVATANVPESRKRGLDQNRVRRAARFVRWLNTAGIDIAAVQESGTYLAATIADRPRWETYYAPANDRVRGRDIGNGIVARRYLRPVAGTHIASRRTGRGGPLHLPVVLFEVGGAQLVVIGVHRQTNRSDPRGRSRKAMDAKLRRYSRRLDRKRIPHVIAGDINGNEGWAKQFPNLSIAAAHTPDIILVSRGIKASDRQAHDLPLVSDHEFVSVTLEIPVGSTAKRLPRI